MGYTHFKETHNGRGGEVNSKFQRSYDRTFLIRTDDPTLGTYYVGSHPSLPTMWSSHPEDPLAWVHSIKPQPDSADPCLWTVTVSYSYTTVPGDGIPNPLLRPPDYEMDGFTWQEATWMDRNGIMLKNTAGDPILPPFEIPRAGATFMVETNYSTPPDSTWIDGQGTLNAATMTIGPWVFGPQALFFEKIRAKRTWETATPFWRWIFAFSYKPYVSGTWRQGHRKMILNQGRRELKSGVLVPITDLATGIPTDQPLPLDNSGVRLSASGTPIWLYFDPLYLSVFPSL